MSDSSRQSTIKHGKLKVFLGYAAGVGKTYQMLEEAQRLKAAGVDVVIGYFEPHGRVETIAKTEGLETVPRKQYAYRGSFFEDTDTEAILRRRPAVCVMDEFAHTNAPGAERKKRWEDCVALLEAGIDVLTSLNVQHLESLNDEVWHISGIRVRETVPDGVVKDASEVVMVDVPPRALMNRLERGVVYAPEKAKAALSNFFNEANLTALRELAMRQTAQQVEVSIDHSVADRVQAATTSVQQREPILIVITPGPETAMLIRRGRRVADYLQTDCFALFIARDERWSGLRAGEREAVEKHMGFAKMMRIEVSVVVDSHFTAALLRFARERDIQQIFLTRKTPNALDVVREAKDKVVTIVAERKRAA